MKFFVGLIASLAILLGLFELREGSRDLNITRTIVGETPMTIFRPQSAAPAPVVVIAHGFAGSQQLMQPFAETLARNGYMAVTFDFLGHGRNPIPMRGDITEGLTITNALLKELTDVAAAARQLPGSDGRLAVLGHSMASDIVVRFAQAHADVEATVAVSVFSPVVTPTSPRNLLVIVGALEPGMLRDEGLRIVNLTAGGTARPGETYGRFSDGTARKLVLARGVEHIGVLYSHDSMIETVRWMNAAFGDRPQDEIDSRGRWMALLFAGIVALAWPLSALLPPLSPAPAGASLGWMALMTAALLPAIATPLLLWKMPTDFLPILLGDYLTLHFLIYGILTTAILLYLHRGRPPAATTKIPWKRTAIAAAAVAAYSTLAFGLPIDAYVFSFLPIPARLPLIAAIACGTLPYFIADEWLTRGPDARRGAYVVTKFCFLLSLAIAVALNPMKLFFLIIIVPAILLLFLAFGLISRWSYAATRNPLPGALANGVVFAWAIGVTFPMIVR
ncbi:alpha/beta fold hydrolase [Bradyrhizobium diazoefficiens]|nr:alpha/beta fold hydrolase [Bradyrhizobium diazoefficiens]UCF51026.1 MAG: alpha/beta fold hydrolase [Bradyrhizobium sp.]MBR0965055.1 alpha/beta fold hydrolase [Bradyrhizobium diazoefficiens]MBR0982085.1 alpha/beta fold hydrolase [Bradyrhizobium diazoefficiens]MBR1008506.1 alpha/beta fold hydrolase [Bradyrhizobium diazoefficiens]MBR1017984.1 alpha/beta fold hydrolase [Bradyrhizobium diazoefficiens]